MKKMAPFLTMLTVLVLSINRDAVAQDENESGFKAGADLYTTYVWRGTRYGHGPSVQPSVKYTKGIFTAGVWGSFDASGYSETDPYFSLAFDNGIGIGLTDYYYPGLPVFEFASSDTTGSNVLELNAGYTKGALSLSGNYIFNQAGRAGSAGGDVYFQATYTSSNFSLFAGAGNGWHTSDGSFALCNLGIGTTKTIEISDKFSIPVNGQIILNPDREQLFVTVGFSF